MKKKYAYIYVEIDNNNDCEASHCSKCDYYLGSYPTKMPKKCPNCKISLIKGGDVKLRRKQYGTKRNR